MFLLKAFLKGNRFWKYLIGSLLIFLASIIGQLPMLFAVLYKLGSEGKSWNNMDERTIMHVYDENTTLFLILISFVFALVGIVISLKVFHNQKLQDIITSRPKIDWKRVLFSFSIWAIFQIVTTAIGYYLSPNDYQWNFHLQPFLILLVIATILIPIQTSVEELVFRGYLMQGFALLAKNRWFPLVMTSVIFGSMHIANPEVKQMGYITLVYYIGTGFFLGIMTLMDEGMELSLGFHAANNLIAALLVTSEWTAFQTNSVLKDVSNPSAGFEIVLPVVVVFPLLLFVFSKRYNWSGWKHKLTGEIEEMDQAFLQEIGNDTNEEFS